MMTYVNVHGILEERRKLALQNNTNGPRVLIAGPTVSTFTISNFIYFCTSNFHSEILKLQQNSLFGFQKGYGKKFIIEDPRWIRHESRKKNNLCRFRCWTRTDYNSWYDCSRTSIKTIRSGRRIFSTTSRLFLWTYIDE